jgi:hypothetical protein
MLMPRAQAVAVIFLAAALHLLLSGKHKLLFALAFLYVWTYDGFPLLLAVVGVYTAVEWLYERKLDARPLAWGAGGVLAGLVVNPFFPKNVVFAWQHVVPKLFTATDIPVGSEWYPYETALLLENSAPMLALFAAALFALGWAGRRMEKRTALALALAILFGFMLFQSRRFIEYFAPVTLLLAAFAFSSLYRPRAEEDAGKRRFWLPALMALALAALIPFTANKAIQTMQATNDLHRYEAASAWLMENTPPGARVFQTDWDDFPQLFFHNHANTYIVGLDPTYMLFYDAQLYDLWVDISQGRSEHLSTHIGGRFGSRYAITDLEHMEFIEQAFRDGYMRVVYQDDYAMVFEIID